MWVRAEAATSLGRLGDPQVTPQLVRVMREHSGPDCDAARKALLALTGTDYVVVP